jgi:hypothetical protein
VQIHVRRAENQVRWVWTEGLQTLGQREIAVIAPWPEHDQRDLLAPGSLILARVVGLSAVVTRGMTMTILMNQA